MRKKKQRLISMILITLLLFNLMPIAAWAVETYTVTFDSQGGTDVPSINDVTSGSTISAPAAPTRWDYTFAGWYKESACTNAWNFSTDTVTGDVTLYAKWTLDPPVITPNGGTYTSEQTVSMGPAFYTTDGSDPRSGSGLYFSQPFTVSQSLTVKAAAYDFITGEWSSVTTATFIINSGLYTVTYNGNGNTGGSVPTDSNNYHQNDSVTVAGNTYNLVRTGYTFNGWNTAANGSGTSYSQGNTFSMPLHDVSLYAQWNINSYTVTFNSNGGSVVDSQTIQYNSTASQPTDPSREGYTFGGWYSNSELTTPYNFTTPVTGAITLYAKWNINSYTVSFNSNGGSAVDSQSIQYNSTVSQPTAPTKEGYTFGGWYSNSELTTPYNFTTPVTGAITLYAKWNINSYTVSFNSNGGSAVSSQTVNYNSAATTPTDPTRTGYTFGGWYSDSGLNTAFNFNTPITADITLYAKWNINSYTVSFNSNGGSAVSSQTVNYNSTATTPTDPTRTGYTFGGWYSDSGLNTAFNFNTPITADTTVYAKWNINSYTVSFNSNGGSEVTSQSVYFNGTATAPTIPVRTGYTFGGWYSDSGLNSTFNFTTPITGNITLYAKWVLRSSGGNNPPPAPEPPKPVPPVPIVPIIPTVPTITTLAASNVTLTQAILNGYIASAGGLTCTKVNFRYRLKGTYNWLDTTTQYVSLGSGEGFSVILTGLKPNASYEFEARAYNSQGWGEGQIYFFTTTSAVLPKVVSKPASDVTMITAAINGLISDKGNADITDSGFEWGELGDMKQVPAAPGTDGSLTFELTGLTPKKTYFFRPYATNLAGTGYGDFLSFKAAFTPIVSTLPATEVDTYTATLHGSADAGVGRITSSGFQISGFPGAKYATPDANGFFSITLTNLKPGATYTYQAFAGNAWGTTYATGSSFTTLTDTPDVETRSPDAVGAATATLSGYIMKNKGLPVIESGFLWGTDAKPGTKVKVGPGIDQRKLTYNLTGLKGGAAYYIQAYAVNSAGTGYGEIISFSTPPATPTVTTSQPVFEAAYWAANLTGNIEFNGGVPLTEFGFKYSADKKNWTTLTTGREDYTGIFTARLEGQDKLPPGTYYVRAYAVSSIGPALGNILNFTTPVLPTVTGSVYNASLRSSSVTVTGKITDTGGKGVACTLRQFQYRPAGSKDWIDAGTEEGSFHAGEFRFKLTGLAAGAQYEFRALAYNRAGWGSSQIISFKTLFGTDKEAAVSMKAAGYKAVDIANVLKSDYGDTGDAALQALLYAKFGVVDIAAALKNSSYNDSCVTVAGRLKLAGFDSLAAADVLQKVFNIDMFWAGRTDVQQGVAKTLAAAGFGIDDVTTVLKTGFNKNIQDAYFTMQDIFPSDARYSSVSRIYGVTVLAGWAWADGHSLDVISRLAGVAKRLKIIRIDPVELPGILKTLYPSLNINDCAKAFRYAGYSAAETGPVLMQVFAPDVSALGYSLIRAPFNKADIENLLINDMRIGALDMARIVDSWWDSSRDVPRVLINNYKLGAADVAKTLYTIGWTEANGWRGTNNNGHGLNDLVEVMRKSFGITDASGLIDILRGLGVSSLAVAQKMSSLFRDNYWLAVWREKGYTATDAAAWYNATHKPSPYSRDPVTDKIGSTIYTLVKDGKYNLDDIVLGIRNVYAIDSATALKIISNTNRSYKIGWADKAIADAIKQVYAEDPVTAMIQAMKKSGASAVQIGLSLKNNFGINDPEKMAAYLNDAGFGQNDVLGALVSFIGGLYGKVVYGKDILQVMSKVLQNVYKKDPKDNIGVMLTALDLTRPRGAETIDWLAFTAISLLKESGYSLYDITRTLKDVYNRPPVLAITLLTEKGYLQADIFAQIQDVYGLDPVMAVIMALKSQGNGALTVAYTLNQRYGMNDPEKLAYFLDQAGYGQAEVLDAVYRIFDHGGNDTIEMLSRIMLNVYKLDPEENFAAILRPLGVKNPLGAISTLDRNGWTMQAIIKVLKVNYSLSPGQIINQLNGYKYWGPMPEVVAEVQTAFGAEVDVAMSYIQSRKEIGEGANANMAALIKFFKITDPLKLADYLKTAGYSQNDVLGALRQKYRESIAKILVNIYGISDMKELAKCFRDLDSLKYCHGTEDAARWIQTVFPTASRLTIATLLRDTGYPKGPTGASDIYVWLMKTPANTRDDALADKLGSAHPGDFGYTWQHATDLLRHEGYDAQQIGKWLQKDKYSIYDVYFGLRYVIDKDRENKALAHLKNMGYNLDEMVRLIVDLHEGYPEWYPRWYFYNEALRRLAKIGFSLQDLTRALVLQGVPMKYLPYMLLSESSYLAQEKRDPGLVLKPQTIVDWSYDALAELPEARRGDVVSQIATGLLSLWQIQYWELRELQPRFWLYRSDIYYAVRSVTARAGKGWENRIPSDAVEAVTDIVNVIHSFTDPNPFSSPTERDEVVYNLMAVYALREGGLSAGDMAETLNDVDYAWLDAYIMMVAGGYGSQEAWDAAGSVTDYKWEFLRTVATLGITQLLKGYKIVKLITNIKKYAGIFKAIGSLAYVRR